LLAYAEKSPPISSFLEDEKTIKLSDDIRLLSSFSKQQKEWRNEFECLINENIDSICVVGNSASLLDKSMGKLVDKHAFILRFNNYCSDVNLQEHCGKNIDAWVKSPDFNEPDKQLGIDVGWTVISGPDVNYTMSDWSNVKLTLAKGGKVVMPPLQVWRDLVKILKAPPSAGLLVIMWIIQITGKADGLSVAGFQTLSENEQEQYHHSSSAHKAGERHNWKEEKKLLKAWQNEGLNFLDSEGL